MEDERDFTALVLLTVDEVTADEMAKLDAWQARVLSDPDVQRYRAWVREGLERGSLWDPKG